MRFESGLLPILVVSAILTILMFIFMGASLWD